MFCGFLRKEHGIDSNELPAYVHFFEDRRRPVLAKAYPEELLAPFRRHFREVWLPEKARGYFAARDPRALDYLPRLLSPPKKKAG
jgi:hypothetical protein